MMTEVPVVEVIRSGHVVRLVLPAGGVVPSGSDWTVPATVFAAVTGPPIVEVRIELVAATPEVTGYDYETEGLGGT